MSNKLKLSAGRYWVGDPCYVIKPEYGFEEWSDALDRTEHFSSSEYRNGGIFRMVSEVNGVPQVGYIAVHGTAYGDGEYMDNYGRFYGVDAGLLSAIPMSSINGEPESRLGHVVDITEDFSLQYRDGVIGFGNVRIDTDPPNEEEGDICPDCDEEYYYCTCGGKDV